MSTPCQPVIQLSEVPVASSIVSHLISGKCAVVKLMHRSDRSIAEARKVGFLLCIDRLVRNYG